MGLHHYKFYNNIFNLSPVGTGFCSVKKWFKAQIIGILPDVFSYISHFLCLYNFNYTGRPLRGRSIVGIFQLMPRAK